MPKQVIKILSFNVHWGLSAFRKRAVEEHLIQTIIREQSDIVLLQEIWLPEEQTMLSMLDHLNLEWEHRITGPTVRFAKGAQGNGMLSRYPFLKWSNQTLSETRRQPRAFLHAELDAGLPLSVICTHFGLNRRERKQQALQLCRYVKDEIPREQALLVGGDFNDWTCQLTPIFEQEIGIQDVFVARRGRHMRTFPAILPLLALDRLYTRHITVTRARVMREAGWHGSSDHLPLAIEVIL